MLSVVQQVEQDRRTREAAIAKYQREFSPFDAATINRMFFSKNINYIDLYKGDGKWARVTLVDMINSTGETGPETWYWYMETKPVAYAELEAETARMLADTSHRVSLVGEGGGEADGEAASVGGAGC